MGKSGYHKQETVLARKFFKFTCREILIHLEKEKGIRLFHDDLDSLNVANS